VKDHPQKVLRRSRWGRLLMALTLGCAPLLWAGSAFAQAQLPGWLISNVKPRVNSAVWQAIQQEVETRGLITVDGSHIDIYPTNRDPASSGLVQNANGSMTITGPVNGNYSATWTSSPTILAPGATVMLLGYSSPNPTVATPPETMAFGTVQTAGTATVTFPASDFYGTSQSPEYFEMMVIYATTPVGDTPEVPYAAGLPLVAGLVLIGLAQLRKRGLELGPPM